jgi:hypothetical protein
MKKWIGRAWLKFFGWDAVGEPPQEKKYVMIAAPHTSNWDLPFAFALAFVFGVEIRWMGKHTLFEPPFGPLMRWLGGVPIERHLRKNVVQQMIDLFEASDELALVVPVEGTRSRVDYWKSGFYHIAYGANVPIALCFLDFEKKRGGFGGTLELTGNVKADMDMIRDFYGDKVGSRPKLFGPIRLRDEAPFERRGVVDAPSESADEG